VIFAVDPSRYWCMDHSPARSFGKQHISIQSDSRINAARQQGNEYPSR